MCILLTTRKNEIENESNVILMVHGRAYVKGDNIFAWLLKYVNMGYEKVVFNSRQNSAYLPPDFVSIRHKQPRSRTRIERG